ncbi:MAG: hypothetical protein BAJALOKI3v1_500012 [Promethearchaeota archaeon]|nr:MAG: hypothetical protein BAJALOKI3v1_500012 [Candidatus Lokiarchaeota archaeon]
MSNAEVSYLDWELSFKNHEPKKKIQKKKEDLTSLGIPKEEFRDYVRKWENRNLK